MLIETKYDIGQKLFFYSLRDNEIRIYKQPIKQINFGGKAWEKYDMGFTTLAEKDLYISFDECKEHAIRKQKKRCDELMEWVNSIKEEDFKS